MNKKLKRPSISTSIAIIITSLSFIFYIQSEKSKKIELEGADQFRTNIKAN